MPQLAHGCFHWLIFSTKNSSNPDFTSEWSLTKVCSIVMTTGRTALCSVPTESRTFWSSDAHAADPRSAHPKPGHEGSHRCFYFGERMGGGLLTQFVQFSFITSQSQQPSLWEFLSWEVKTAAAWGQRANHLLFISCHVPVLDVCIKHDVRCVR